MPFLCAYLFLKNGSSIRSRADLPYAESHAPDALRFHFPFSVFLLAACALLYAPTRLIQETNPEWRLVSWLLALEVVGITFCGMHLLRGALPPSLENEKFPGVGAQCQPGHFAQVVLRSSAFPICFFLVSVPWPAMIEGPVIQALTRMVSGQPRNCLDSSAFL